MEGQPSVSQETVQAGRNLLVQIYNLDTLHRELLAVLQRHALRLEAALSDHGLQEDQIVQILRKFGRLTGDPVPQGLLNRIKGEIAEVLYPNQ